jgi:TonB family protein
MTALLLDHLWQSTAVLVFAAMLALLFRNNGAHVRHGLWLAASVKFLLPFAALTTLGGYASVFLASRLQRPAMIAPLETVAQPFSAYETAAVAGEAADWLVPVIAVWALGVLALGAFWLARWLKLRAAVDAARDAAITAPVPVKLSPHLMEPGLVGIFRPTLLLPEGIAEKLSPVELQAILSHEDCHRRRRDNLTAALHMLVEAIFWFWPPVWWLGTRLVLERERACDEAVLASGNDPQVYATSILKVCKFYVQSPLACAAGVSGADLKQRMEEIMGKSVIARLSMPRKALLAAAMAATLALPMLLGLPNVPVALAQSVLPPALSPPARLAGPAVPVPTARPSRRLAMAGAPVRDPATQPVVPRAVEAPAAESSPSLASAPQLAEVSKPAPVAQGACMPSGLPATHTMPPYPPISRRLGEIGTVEMRITIAPDGIIGDAAITYSSGYARLDEAAIAHVRGNWLWEPSNCGSAETKVRVAFSLLDAR